MAEQKEQLMKLTTEMAPEDMKRLVEVASGLVDRRKNPPATATFACPEPKDGPKKIWYAPNRFEAYGEEEIKAVEDCLRDGWLAPGPRTAKFEEEVSKFFGKKNGVMVNSGSSANMIGLCVLDLKPGDEIITPACTFSTVLAPIEQLGLTPVFVDVAHARYVPTVEAVLGAITPKTRVLMIPNLVGAKIDWLALKEGCKKMGREDIVLFEDSCDTMTHTPCTDMAAISFYASHIMTAGGCGGMIMFNTEKLKQKALMYRDWGRIGNNSEDVSERFGYAVDGIEYDFKFLYGVKGFNFKCCEMNAAFGLAQFAKLPKLMSIRASNIDRFVKNLSKQENRFVLPADYEKFDWLAFPLMYHDRKGLLRCLEAHNIQTRVTFSGNITRHPAYRHYLNETDYPESDRVMAEGLLLGAHHGLSYEDIDRVTDVMIKYDKGELDDKNYAEMAANQKRTEVTEDASDF